MARITNPLVLQVVVGFLLSSLARFRLLSSGYDGEFPIVLTFPLLKGRLLSLTNEDPWVIRYWGSGVQKA